MKPRKIYFFIQTLLLLMLLSLIVTAGIPADKKIKVSLSDVISKTSADEKIPVIIFFNENKKSFGISSIELDGIKIKRRYKIIDAAIAEISAKEIGKISKKFSVKSIELDYKVKVVLDKSIPRISADLVWETGITGKGIDVAIIDTGIDDDHLALTVEKKVDFTGEGTDDLHGHGTHVAGIVASTDLNYMGVAPGAHLFNVKVLDQKGEGYESGVIMGIEWAVNNGAEIISISLGGEVTSCDGTDALSQAVDAAVDHGVVVIIAAGNSGPDSGTITAPGCSKKGIAVGAVNGSSSVPDFSSRGPTADGRIKPDVVAPGVSITSTWKGNSFHTISGTSMATPHVAGIAALLLEAAPSLEPEEIKNILRSTAVDLGLDENTQGAGMVDAYEAVYDYISFESPIIHTFAPDWRAGIFNQTKADGGNIMLDIKGVWEYTGVNYPVANEDFLPNGIYWDKEYWWMTGESSEAVHKYYPNWTYTGDSHSFHFQDDWPQDIFWNGSNWFMLGGRGKDVNVYDSNWSYITTYNLDELSWHKGMFWDKEYWWVGGRTADAVFKYYSNWTYTGINFSLNPPIDNPMDIYWDGNNWWILGTYKVWKFNSDWTYAGENYTINAQDRYMEGIAHDGSDWWLVGRENDNVYKYQGKRNNASGTYTSKVIDAKQTVRWDNLSWITNEPNGTEIRFQVRSCSHEDCSDRMFVGPDNTSSTYFTSNTTLNTTLTPNNQYFQYKIFLFTGNTSVTSHLESIEIGYTGNPISVTLNSPIDNYSADLANITFNCSAASIFYDLSDVTFYIDTNNSWSPVETQTLSGTSDEGIFNLDLSGYNTFRDDSYEWNCLVYDVGNNKKWADNNATFSTWDLGSYVNTIGGKNVRLVANATNGSYTSQIFDAGTNFIWGNFSWDSYEPSSKGYTWNYTGINFAVDEVGLPRDMELVDNYLWIVGTGNKEVHKYYLNGTYIESYSIAQDAYPQAIEFDGNNWYMVGFGSNTVYEYTSEWGYTGKSYNISEIGAYLGLEFDGSNWYVVDSNYVYKYYPNWTYTGVKYNIADQERVSYDIEWDGNNWWLIGNYENTAFKYTPDWTYTGISINLTEQDHAPTGIVFDGAYWWMIGQATDTVYKYETLTYSQIKFQVRSCSKADCSDNIFIGPDNTPLTYFTSNTTLNSALTPNNQYFQYKAYLSIPYNDVPAAHLSSFTVSGSDGTGDTGGIGIININLQQGWNLISIPLNLTNKTLPFKSIQGNYSKIFTYINNRWIELKDNDKINESYGYWIKMLNNDTLELEGTVQENVTINLVNGLNLIGYPSLNISLINETLKDVNYSVVYGYNVTWSGYNPLRNSSLKYFTPGYGYWVDSP